MFAITAVFSILAYLWLIFVLMGVSKNVVSNECQPLVSEIKMDINPTLLLVTSGGSVGGGGDFPPVSHSGLPGVFGR